MKKILLLVFPLIFVSFFTAHLAAKENGSSAAPQTARLSDHTQTEGGLGFLPNIRGVVAGNNAYATWVETIAADNYQLFLRQLPDGPIQTLPYTETVSMPGFPNRYIYLTAVGHENGRACFTWDEIVSDEGSNLVLWCSDFTQEVELSDNALSEGNIIRNIPDPVRMMFDSTGTLHVFWVEEGLGSFRQELYHWDENSQAAQRLSDNSTDSFVISMDVLLTNNNIYAAWSEFSPSGVFTPYLWDIDSDNVQDLSLPNESYASSLNLLQDANGTVHLVWVGDFTGSPTGCPFHWDNLSKQTSTIGGVNNGCTIADYKLFYDEAFGTVHLVYVGEDSNGQQDALYHWAPGGVQTLVYDGVSNDSTLPITLLADSSGVAHVIFPAGTDMYYWNSNEQTATNISDASITTQDISFMEVTVQLDSNNVVHAAWAETIDATGEDDLFYWRSDSGMTVRLSDTAVTSGDAQNPALNEDDNGIMHIIWQETALGTGLAALFHWDSTNTATTLLANMGSASSVLRYLWADPADNWHAAWTRNTGSDDDLFYFDETNGVINLSTQAGTNGEIVYDVETIQRLDGPSAWYLLWAEDSGTGEAEDLLTAYAANPASPPPDLGNSIYLPMVQR